MNSELFNDEVDGFEAGATATGSETLTSVYLDCASDKTGFAAVAVGAAICAGIVGAGVDFATCTGIVGAGVGLTTCSAVTGAAATVALFGSA